MDISKHPLLKQTYELCGKIEACGASVELTAAVSAAGDLMTAIDKEVDAHAVALQTSNTALESSAKDAGRWRHWINMNEDEAAKLYESLEIIDGITDKQLAESITKAVDEAIVAKNLVTN